MEIGQRVRIYIYNPDMWVTAAVECLNGKTGVLKEIKEPNWYSDNRFLVEFDTPAKTWHSYQTPWTAAWFHEKDLLIEPLTSSWQKKEDQYE